MNMNILAVKFLSITMPEKVDRRIFKSSTINLPFITLEKGLAFESLAKHLNVTSARLLTRGDHIVCIGWVVKPGTENWQEMQTFHVQGARFILIIFQTSSN